MRSFRQFLTSENIGSQQSATSNRGSQPAQGATNNQTWSFRTHKQGSQPFEVPVGGFQNGPQIAQWYNQGRMGVANFPGTEFRYDIVDMAVTELGNRLMRLAEAVRTKPPDAPVSIREAEFDPVDPSTIHGVGAAFFMGVHLGGKLPIFELAQHFGIITQDTTTKHPGKFTVNANKMRETLAMVEKELDKFYRKGEYINMGANAMSAAWRRMNQSHGGPGPRADYQWQGA